jgi:NAD(P)-dependent dehydrogenase (short-subunit alcohol dehydrogenase family)
MAARFDGKTVIVTGGNSGIGQAIAVAFAREGAKVIVTGRRQDAVDETTRLHANISGIVADVQSEPDAKRVVEAALEVGGGLDVLVNNAGIANFSPLATVDLKSSQQIFGINVLGLLTVSKVALEPLIASKGVIINISSVAGHGARAGGSVYAASKAAVNSFTLSWAAELASQGVRVNAVAPGPIDTPIFGKIGASAAEIEGIKEQIVASVPLGRIGQPEEVAQWTLHLADPAAAWITGQVIGVDGGSA